ncbi:MAG: hypothetical protein AB1Z98_09505 [Nannocystaceae bacterium]
MSHAVAESLLEDLNAMRAYAERFQVQPVGTRRLEVALDRGKGRWAHQASRAGVVVD